jgi:glycogen(starch) synthase
VRVLTVGNMYPPHHLGGYELIWQESVRRLRAHGHDVVVLTSDFRRGERAEEDEDVHRELRLYWRDHSWPRFGLRARLALERHNAGVFDRLVAERRPEAILWGAMGGMSLSLIGRAGRRGLPAVAIVCDEWLLYGPQRDAWVNGFRGARRLAAPLAERLTGIPARLDTRAISHALFPSEILRDRSAQAHALPRTSVVHQGADRSQFREAPARPWSWRLLYAGRIDPRKGIDLAVRALAELPREATLSVAGGGDEHHLAELRELARATGVEDRIRFTEVPRGELAEEYAAADALLFPVRWLEPWGLVPLEAMAVGTPVVASGRGGSGEYLRDGENSLLVDVDAGPGALAGAVSRLAGDEALRARLRLGGLKTAGEIDEDEWHVAVERLLREPAAGASSGEASG